MSSQSQGNPNKGKQDQKTKRPEAKTDATEEAPEQQSKFYRLNQAIGSPFQGLNIPLYSILVNVDEEHAAHMLRTACITEVPDPGPNAVTVDYGDYSKQVKDRQKAIEDSEKNTSAEQERLKTKAKA